MDGRPSSCRRAPVVQSTGARRSVNGRRSSIRRAPVGPSMCAGCPVNECPGSHRRATVVPWMGARHPFDGHPSSHCLAHVMPLTGACPSIDLRTSSRRWVPVVLSPGARRPVDGHPSGHKIPLVAPTKGCPSSSRRAPVVLSTVLRRPVDGRPSSGRWVPVVLSKGACRPVDGRPSSRRLVDGHPFVQSTDICRPVKFVNIQTNPMGLSVAHRPQTKKLKWVRNRLPPSLDLQHHIVETSRHKTGIFVHVVVRRTCFYSCRTDIFCVTPDHDLCRIRHILLDVSDSYVLVSDQTFVFLCIRPCFCTFAFWCCVRPLCRSHQTVISVASDTHVSLRGER